ncbi:cytochrome c/FTR1 family iron permease [Thauera propionica]|uniref:cytochrome c/FTR1 family iron permease n=1 Tax=Thauera propionica TaxID=2019431 RepID=UPI0023F25862|nr:cytochrome c/FTR1 family iron permease [Thauera propionica]MDD3677281.1 cytochrome c/FTR1 family iron permease [Thauera propionica]
MPWPAALMRFCLFSILSGLAPAGAAEPAAADPRQTWQMLDHIAVDYAGAVQAGRIADAGEYAEMQEFATAVRSQLAALPVTPEQPVLQAEADRLGAAIAAKAEPAQVASLARRLADGLLANYPIGAVPASPPSLARAAPLYAQQCAACHGSTGHGDGTAAAGLDPPPIAFTDADRAAQRTPLALYEVISQGVAGTAMTGFPQLSEADRWALAFYVGGMAYSPEMRRAGETRWRQNAKLRDQIPTLEVLTRTREAELARTVGATQARELLAYVRSRPQAITEASSEAAAPLALARQRLAASLRAYIAGDVAGAQSLALSAYLDGIEPVEPTLATRDAPLLRELETAMAQFRAQIGRREPATAVSAQAEVVTALFDRAEAVLQATHTDPVTAFLGSFIILLREGLEALLIVIGMIAFLRKAERQEVLPYVHAGWIVALLAGAATWAVATYLVDISGANREVTEGVSALFATAVLLSVGIWMHGKSLAGRWQQYLHARMSVTLTRRSAIFLFLLAFVAVYREVFETILFYIAMWSPAAATAIVAGLVAGIVVLVGVAYWLLRISRRLPISRFFSVSSILIAVLAVVLVGKGVAALQEAGWVPQALIAVSRIEWLGVYPSWQSLLAQLLVATVAIVGFIVNTRSAQVLAHAVKPTKLK